MQLLYAWGEYEFVRLYALSTLDLEGAELLGVKLTVWPSSVDVLSQQQYLISYVEVFRRGNSVIVLALQLLCFC
jgi:hypothetical protein